MEFSQWKGKSDVKATSRLWSQTLKINLNKRDEQKRAGYGLPTLTVLWELQQINTDKRIQADALTSATLFLQSVRRSDIYSSGFEKKSTTVTLNMVEPIRRARKGRLCGWHARVCDTKQKSILSTLWHSRQWEECLRIYSRKALAEKIDDITSRKKPSEILRYNFNPECTFTEWKEEREPQWR